MSVQQRNPYRIPPFIFRYINGTHSYTRSLSLRVGRGGLILGSEVAEVPLLANEPDLGFPLAGLVVPRHPSVMGARLRPCWGSHWVTL